MPEDSILSVTEITIQDYNDNNPVIFSNLTLNESFINTNNFSFTVRGDRDEGSLSSVTDFKKQVLGKDVQIQFKDGGGSINHQFKGKVLEISSLLIDNNYYEFYISGKGLFCKVDEIPEYHSFYKKKLDAIIDTAFQSSQLKSNVKKDTKTTTEFLYIVHYNQSLFGFMSSLAIRFGEWMYYDGENLKFGKKPEGEAIELRYPSQIDNFNVRSRLIKAPKSFIGTDNFKGEKITSDQKKDPPDNELIKAANDAGNNVFETEGENLFAPSGFNQAYMDGEFQLEQNAIYGSSVFFTGSTRNNKLSVGKIIEIKEGDSSSGNKYILLQVQHSVASDSAYHNVFTAVPVELEVPPYTNPGLYPKATPQAAVVTDNEDDAGMARVKVKFPWMGDNEKTPWISVLVPHAGKDKGFRFLPEKDDEVLIDFWDNNAETPFVSGAVYTNKNKSGIAESGNNVKLIGSRSGRRLEINDDQGLLFLEDNFPDQTPMNIISLHRKDYDKKIMLESKASNDQYTAIRLDNENALNLGLVVGGDLWLEINMEKTGPKITIKSKGDIEIQADQNINMNASEINLSASNIKINADNNLEMKGSAEAKLEGTQVKIEGSGILEAKASSTKVEGSGILELKGGGVASLEAGIVKIN